MKKEKRLVETPYFSICIPQYNRTAFLIEALKSFAEQTFKNFEVCISDGGSTDGAEKDLLDYLDASGLSYVYVRQEDRHPYDKNLRASIGLAKGEYCFLNGNDDALKERNTLQQLHDKMIEKDNVGVVVTNYEDWKTGVVAKRVTTDEYYETGPWVAATHYRNVAFVSGIVLHREASQELYTEQWDGSEMYQMYLMASIIASGKYLFETDLCTAKKDILLTAETVESYATKKHDCEWFQPLNMPMKFIGPLISQTVGKYIDEAVKSKIAYTVFKQLYAFTYPFWVFEYRRVASWKYALSYCVMVSPHRLLKDVSMFWHHKIFLWGHFIMYCLMGLIIPVSFFFRLKPFLFKIAKSFK